MNDNPGLMNKIFNSVAGDFFTPQRSDNKSFGNNLGANSVASEALNSSDSQSPTGSNKTSKAYTQQDIDKLKAEMQEQFRIQLAIDQNTTRAQIQNYYQDQFKTMENESKEKLAIIVQGPFSCNCAKVLISIFARFSCLFLLGLCINIYIA